MNIPNYLQPDISKNYSELSHHILYTVESLDVIPTAIIMYSFSYICLVFLGHVSVCIILGRRDTLMCTLWAAMQARCRLFHNPRHCSERTIWGCLVIARFRRGSGTGVRGRHWRRMSGKERLLLFTRPMAQHGLATQMTAHASIELCAAEVNSLGTYKCNSPMRLL